METPKRARVRQQPDETRAVILDHAEELLRTRPYRELSVDEVMRPTGYRRTVFYRHFTGLPDLVMAVLARAIPPFAAAGEAFTAVADQPLDHEQTRAHLRPIVEHWAANGTLMRAVRDAAVYDGFVDQLAEMAQVRVAQAALQALRGRRAAGRLQTADLDQLALLLVGMNQRYLLSTFGDGPGADVEVALDTLALAWTSIMNAP